MQCVILTGGLGTRIRDRSGDLPKALIPIQGRPFIFYQLEWLARQDVRQIVLSVGHRGSMIAQAVGDGSQLGVSAVYCDEGETLRGTGGALRLGADRGLLDEAFFILYGDSYLPIQLAPVWQTSEAGQVCTMTILRNAGRWDRSNVAVRDGQILYDKFAADPVSLGMDYIDYGLSVLRRDVILEQIAAGDVVDLARPLNVLSISNRLRGHEVVDRFYEIGSAEGLDDFEHYVRARLMKSSVKNAASTRNQS